MVKIISFLVLFNVIAVYCANNGTAVFPPEPHTSTVAPTSPPTSSAAPTSPPTTVTTSATTTSSSTTPSTTTTASTTPPPKTTPSTTTTPPTPTTTTTTTTTTTPKPTPAPITTTTPPAPIPKEGTWQIVNTTTNETCIFLKTGGVIQLNYTNNGSKNEEPIQINIAGNAKASGTCGETKQSIKLSWNETINNSVELVFTKNDSKFELDNITVSLDPKNFPNAKDNNSLVLVHVAKDYTTPTTMSYKCTKPAALNLNTTHNNTKVGTITFFDLQVQAFAHIKDAKFADAKDCEPYETPDIVPIAVGCALMALIVMVLVGYLIGRRRNQARGYLSM